MEIKQKTGGAKALFTGSLIAGALFSFSALQAAPAEGLFNYNALGNGASVRTALSGSSSAAAGALELKCGAKKSDSTAKKTTDHKCGEGKCGEGKCGSGHGKKMGKGKKGK